MNNLIPAQPTPKAINGCETVIERMLYEMTQLNEQMREDRIEINRLKAETDFLKAETHAVLLRMGVRL